MRDSAVGVRHDVSDHKPLGAGGDGVPSQSQAAASAGRTTVHTSRSCGGGTLARGRRVIRAHLLQAGRAAHRALHACCAPGTVAHCARRLHTAKINIQSNNRYDPPYPHPCAVTGLRRDGAAPYTPAHRELTRPVGDVCATAGRVEIVSD